MHRILGCCIECGNWLSFPDNKVLINLVSAFPGGRELSDLEWGLLNLRLLKENVCCCAGQCGPPEQAVSILGPALSRCSGPSGVRSCISLHQQILPVAPTFPMAQRNQSQEAWLQWLSKGQALQASKSERYCQSVGFVIPTELHRKHHPPQKKSNSNNLLCTFIDTHCTFYMYTQLFTVHIRISFCTTINYYPTLNNHWREDRRASEIWSRASLFLESTTLSVDWLDRCLIAFVRINSQEISFTFRLQQ